MFKYVTLNGDLYVRTERVTARLVRDLIVTKCRQLRISAYNFIHLLG